MANIGLTMAIGEYDHVRDFAQGLVRAEGIDINWLNLPIEEIFHRFIKFREWDVSELSFAKYVALVSQGDADITGIPVFPSRVFRHSSFYVNSRGKIREPGELKGKRIGIPEWAQTAAVYTRGRGSAAREKSGSGRRIRSPPGPCVRQPALSLLSWFRSVKIERVRRGQWKPDAAPKSAEGN